MKEWLQVLKAADAAAKWHVHQRRKGPAEEPYINHLLEVAMLVADATGGTDTNLVIAALLHDAIEDCEVPRELIAGTFGDDVASIIEEVTDDKSLPKQVRKDEQAKTASVWQAISSNLDAQLGCWSLAPLPLCSAWRCPINLSPRYMIECRSSLLNKILSLS
jgi:(p)ppGpp synthase/HD superfamily hydrolase